MAHPEGRHWGTLQKQVDLDDHTQLARRTTESGGEDILWAIWESDIPRVWQSWIIATLPDSPQWTAAVRLEPDQDGEFVAAELRVFPTEHHSGDEYQDPRNRGEWSHTLDAVPPGGLRARDLRSLPIAGHVREGKRAAREAVSSYVDELAAHAERLGHAVDPQLQTWLAALDRPLNPSSGRGRQISDLDYVRVAVVYLQHCETGSTSPAADTAHQLGPDWTSTKVREWLRRARSRQRGLLTKVPQGTSGGQLTDKAHGILSAHHRTQQKTENQ